GGIVSPTQLATDVRGAVTSGILSGDQAVCVLAAMSAGGNSAVQLAAAGVIAGLINGNTVTGSNAISEINANAGSIQGPALLIDIAAAGGAAQQAAIAGIAGVLDGNIGSSVVSTAMAEFTAAVANHVLTADQAVAVLVGVAAQDTGPNAAAVRTTLGG